jgi:hypothetical protein
MSSPTARSLAYLREQGWHAEVVERNERTPHKTWKVDLFGFADVLAIRAGERLLVQATDDTSVSKRVRKVADSPLVGLVREAGFRIEVWGWRRDGRLRVVDLS